MDGVGAGGTPDEVRRRLVSLNSDAYRLSDGGRVDLAARFLEDAIRLAREAIAAGDDATQPELAMSLVNWSNCLGELGRAHDAFEAAEEGVSVYRQLMREQDEEQLAIRYALALDNLRHYSLEVAQIQRALEASDRCIETYERLEGKHPGRFGRSSADAYGARGRVLAQLGRPSDALEAFMAAVGTYRALHAGGAAPDADTDLSVLLTDQATVLRSLGRGSEALELIEESLSLSRGVSEVRSEKRLASRAVALANKSTRLAEAGLGQDALLPASEAVVILRALASTNGPRYVPDLAAALNNQSNRLAEHDYRDEALTAIEEAVELRRDLAGKQPERYAPDLAGSLANLSHRLAEAGRLDEALGAASEGVAMADTCEALSKSESSSVLVSALLARATRRADLGTAPQAFKDVERAATTVLQLPKPDAELARSACQLYERLAAEAAVKQDPELLRRLRAVGQAEADQGRDVAEG